VYRANQGHDAERDERIALQDAHGAGLQADLFLEIKGEADEACAGDEDRGEDDPGRDFHGFDFLMDNLDPWL
jgi:hypothetical protein